MESLSKVDESFPTPPPYFLPGKTRSHFSLLYMTRVHIYEKLVCICLFVLVFFPPDESQIGQDVRVYHVHSPFSPLPPPPSFSFSPGVGCSTLTQSPLPGTCSLKMSAPILNMYTGCHASFHLESSVIWTIACGVCPFVLHCPELVITFEVRSRATIIFF